MGNGLHLKFIAPDLSREKRSPFNAEQNNHQLGAGNLGKMALQSTPSQCTHHAKKKRFDKVVHDALKSQTERFSPLPLLFRTFFHEKTHTQES